VIDNITVQDTIPPAPPIITNAPSGDVKGVLLFDWIDGNDPSGIMYYVLIIDNESNPENTPGYVFQINITNTGSESSFYEFSEPLKAGQYYYFLYQIDGVGHQSSSTIGTFNIIISSNPFETILKISIIIICSTAALVVLGIMVNKRYLGVSKFQRKIRTVKKKLKKQKFEKINEPSRENIIKSLIDNQYLRSRIPFKDKHSKKFKNDIGEQYGENEKS